MTDEENWKVRGLYSQIACAQASVVEALASNKLTDNRIRDLKRALEHIAEQLSFLREPTL